MPTNSEGLPIPDWAAWRRRLLVGVAVCALLLGLESLRPPEDQWTARVLLAAIDLYQATLSPLMPVAGVECRFTPTCSHYGEGVIRKHGTLVGVQKTVWRILRCNPMTEQGTHDPP